MIEKRKSPEHELKQMLKDRKAENDALRKLIAALHKEETSKKAAKTNSGESLQIKTI